VGSIPMHFRQRKFKGIPFAGYPLFVAAAYPIGPAPIDFLSYQC